MQILIIDDSRTNVAILSELVRGIGALPVACTNAGCAIAEAERVAPDLVIVDYAMPMMSGLEVVSQLHTAGLVRDLPIVMITASEEVSVRHAALDAGVTDFIRRPIDPIEVKSRLRNLLRLRDAQLKLSNRAAWLAAEVDAATQKIAAREEEIILRLARAAEHRDGETGAHIVRMARYCQIVAEKLGLEPSLCRIIYLAAPMHDVGKIGVSDAILLKRGGLTSSERATIEQHTIIGETILDGSESELIELARVIAGTHHERWDGNGYPRGLQRGQIPLAGRIAAVADVFDALTSERPYKTAWSAEEARARIVADSGKHFDPDCVNAFLAGWEEIHRICINREHGANPNSGV
jgi:putative two-component system response regulator